MAEAKQQKRVMVHVKVVEAIHIPIADISRGTTDAYVKLKVKGHAKKYKTSVVSRTKHPAWREEFTFALDNLSEDLILQLYDQDFLRDEFLGKVIIPLSDLQKNGGVISGWFDFRDKKYLKRKKGSLYVKLVLDEERVSPADKAKHADFREKFMAHRQTLLVEKTKDLINKAPDAEKLQLFVGTWNVGNRPPPDDLAAFIPKDKFDLYAIGAQECEYKPRKGYSNCREDWEGTVGKFLGDKYSLVGSHSLMQMRLVVFASNETIPKITHVETHTEATGVGSVVGNKGGVVVSVHVHATRLCFINSHLAAHQHKTAKRNSDVSEIIKGVGVGYKSLDIISQFHHVIWMGDLNYRLNYGDQGDEKTPSEAQFKEMVGKIKNKEYQQLFACDQLAGEMKEERVFRGFHEGEFNFNPTFKVKREHELEYDEERSPAWCDRILWKSFPGQVINQTQFGCANLITTSDHKPVFGHFEVLTSRPAPGFTESLGGATIKIKSLKGSDLPAADVGGGADPYVRFVGDFILGEEVRSKRKDKTLSPVWEPSDLPDIDLVVNNPTRLQKETLMFGVWDWDATSGDDQMGCGYLSLTPYVNSPGVDIPFAVELSAGGLPAGRLEGVMSLAWKPSTYAKRPLA